MYIAHELLIVASALLPDVWDGIGQDTENTLNEVLMEIQKAVNSS